MATIDQLIELLTATRDDILARDIPGKLGVSQPTFSRLAAGSDRIISYGAKLEKRYTLRTPSNGMDEIPIYQVGESGTVSNFGKLLSVRNDRFVFEADRGAKILFDGLPWFVYEIRPQGFLGKGFSAQNPELGLPASIIEWGDYEIVKALSSRGEDLPGNLIVGRESLDRHLRGTKITIAMRSDYQEMAALALSGDIAASSAGGEQPKFPCFNGDKHLIVKFSATLSLSDGARRWGDLIVCEDVANKVLEQHMVSVAQTTVFEGDNRIFLESERFDRTLAGRKAVVSLSGLDSEFVGNGSGWVRTVSELLKQKLVSADTLEKVRILNTFGQFIGNSDMHHGNLSFHANESYSNFSIAPVYDMVPMMFAPSSQGEISEKMLVAPTPTPDTMECWVRAKDMAKTFWNEVLNHELISMSFKTIATSCLAEIQKTNLLATLVSPGNKNQNILQPNLISSNTSEELIDSLSQGSELRSVAETQRMVNFTKPAYK